MTEARRKRGLPDQVVAQRIERSFNVNRTVGRRIFGHDGVFNVDRAAIV